MVYIGAGSNGWDKFYEAAETLKGKGYGIISSAKSGRLARNLSTILGTSSVKAQRFSTVLPLAELPPE